MDCETCGKRIPEGRLEALPDATTCVECSREVPRSESTPGVIPIADTEELYKETR